MMTTTDKVTIQEMPITLDLPDMVAGSDYKFSIYFKDDNRDPTNTTGWDASIKIRAIDSSGDVLFTLTVGSGITHTPSAGRLDIWITKTQTATINVPSVVWDVKVTDASGVVTYPFQGSWKIIQPVTR